MRPSDEFDYRRDTKVIGSTDGIELLFMPGVSETILVTFNGLGTMADGQTITAGEAARKLGLPALGFMSRHGNWFPIDQMAILAPRASEILNAYVNRVHYGFSMGGFGAIKYSGMLGATQVLALGPQWSIDPEIAPWERRYIASLQPWHKSMEITPQDCRGNIFVVYDNYDPDRLHAERINQVTKCKMIITPFVGHDVWRLFLSSKFVGVCIHAMMRNDDRALQRLVRQRRHVIPEIESRLCFSRAQSLSNQRRYREAERVARRALEATNAAPGVGFLLCRILIALGRAPEAETIIRSEMQRSPEITWLGLYLSMALEAQCRPVEALEAVAPVYALLPHLSGAAEAVQRLTREIANCEA